MSASEIIPRNLLNGKLSENMQLLVTADDRQRIEWMARTEGHSQSEMLRILCLESLDIWEKSAPGRRRRKA